MTASAMPLPRHVAIIMDGNGRWAQSKGWPRMRGHQKGVETVRRTVEACIDLGIAYLTLFAFSTENWRRSEAEVQGLMLLLGKTIKEEFETFHKNNIRLKVIGRRDRLPSTLISLIEDVEKRTAENTALTLVIALDYGGRDEIARAATKAIAAGETILTEDTFVQYLDTRDIPDPDLFIRTSNVIRVSNFLIWQLAYTEFVFLDVHWPDFEKEHLEEAISHFQNCERRFGYEVAQETLCA